jgi:hypothetical protein
MPLPADGIFITPVLRAPLCAIDFLTKILARVCYERVNRLTGWNQIGGRRAGAIVRLVDFLTAVRFFRNRRINSPVGLLTDHKPVIGDEMRSVQVLSLAVSNQPLFAHLRNKMLSEI